MATYTITYWAGVGTNQGHGRVLDMVQHGHGHRHGHGSTWSQLSFHGEGGGPTTDYVGNATNMKDQRSDSEKPQVEGQYLECPNLGSIHPHGVTC